MEILEDQGLKQIYNFTYRLVGSEDLAIKILAEHYQTYQQRRISNVLPSLQFLWQHYRREPITSEEGGCFIQKSLLTLPAELRCVLILRDNLNFSYEEIAYILDTSQQNVSRLLQRGRTLFRANLTKEKIASK